MPEDIRPRGLELLEVLTVGLPFCGFKLLGGLAFSGAGPLLRLTAAPLLALGAADAAINGANLAGLLFRSRRATDDCFFSLATRPFRARSAPSGKWREFGDSLDALLSFALVALMIGGGFLRTMPASRLAAWNACVILNVLGAGLGRFGLSLRDLSRDERC
jgi:hypothetical protein